MLYVVSMYERGGICMHSTYSITEVAEKLEISTSTIRKYEQDYFLDIIRNEIGHRVYTNSDIDILKKIIQLKNEGANIHLIRKMLDKEEIIKLPVEISNNESPAYVTYMDNIERFKIDIVEGLQEQFGGILQKELQEQEERIVERITQKQSEQIRAENSRLMDYIAVTREEEKKKGFFGRLFNR